MEVLIIALIVVVVILFTATLNMVKQFGFYLLFKNTNISTYHSSNNDWCFYGIC